MDNTTIEAGDYYMSETRRGLVQFYCDKIDPVLDLVVGFPVDHKVYVDGRDRENCIKIPAYVECAAHAYADLKDSRIDDDEQYFNTGGCAKYDAFIAGAMSKEADAYYKDKYERIIVPGDGDYEPSKDIEDSTVLLARAAREGVTDLINKGSLLAAVKFYKDCYPEIGLKEAKQYVDSLRK